MKFISLYFFPYQDHDLLPLAAVDVQRPLLVPVVRGCPANLRVRRRAILPGAGGSRRRLHVSTKQPHRLLLPRAVLLPHKVSSSGNIC